MNLNHSQYFITTSYFLMGKHGVTTPVEVVRDNRIDCPCCVDQWDNKEKIRIKFNSKLIRNCSKSYIMSVILHEIGHILQDLPYATEQEIIDCEHQAELFALSTLKKHYKNDYKEVKKQIKNMKSLKICFENDKIRNPYYWAFKKIPEYWNSLSKKEQKELLLLETQLNEL